jgi:hypothetical protein
MKNGAIGAPSLLMVNKHVYKVLSRDLSCAYSPFQKRPHKRTYQLLKFSHKLRLHLFVGSNRQNQLIVVFNSEIIHCSISGLRLSVSSYLKPSILAYKLKNEYVLYKVPKNFLRTSAIPSRNFVPRIRVRYHIPARCIRTIFFLSQKDLHLQTLDIFCPCLKPVRLKLLLYFVKTKVPIV